MNTQAQLRPGAKLLPWYRHRWPWLLMIGPALVVLAGAYTTWLAVKSSDALVVDDYYKQGKAINQDLRRDRVASQLKMGAELAYDPAAGRLLGKLSGDPAARSGAIHLRLVHSTQPEKDQSFLLKPDPQGHFSAALPMLEIARWNVLVENESREWRLLGTWKWPQDKTITIHAELAASNAQ